MFQSAVLSVKFKNARTCQISNRSVCTGQGCLNLPQMSVAQSWKGARRLTKQEAIFESGFKGWIRCSPSGPLFLCEVTEVSDTGLNSVS